MALPKQVQAQLAEVEELEKQLSARPDPEKVEEPPKEEVTETEKGDAVQDKAKTPKPEAGKSSDKRSTDVADDFEQKYRTLRGKYDSEVPRLHQQVRDLTQSLEDLRKELTAKAEPTKPEEPVSYVTDADRAEFGEELIDVQRRVAKEVAREYGQQLDAQAKVIEDLRARLDSTGSQVGEMTFLQRLNALVPDFAQVDNDERWIKWLNEYDPMLRGPRRNQAKAAFEAGDAEAVADYVKLWKASINDTSKAEEPQKAARELEKQVAPNRTANSARTQANGSTAKIYSAREVETAWKKIRVLNTRGEADAAAKLEAEITAAYLEGRVQ